MNHLFIALLTLIVAILGGCTLHSPSTEEICGTENATPQHYEMRGNYMVEFCVDEEAKLHGLYTLSRTGSPRQRGTVFIGAYRHGELIAHILKTRTASIALADFVIPGYPPQIEAAAATVTTK